MAKSKIIGSANGMLRLKATIKEEQSNTGDKCDRPSIQMTIVLKLTSTGKW